MIEVIQSLIIEYLPTILTFVLTAIATFVSKKYNKYINDETKRKVAKTVVNAIEQLYKDLDGKEKLQKAKEGIIEMLNEKGISITELEINMLIEEVCNSFNQAKREE